MSSGKRARGSHSIRARHVGLLAGALAIASTLGCHSQVTEPSDHAHVFAPTDHSSACWTVRRTWTGEYGADVFSGDQVTSVERATCFPIFRSTGTLTWSYDIPLPRAGRVLFELAEMNPPAAFTATIKTCGCADSCGVGTSLVSLGAGPVWTIDLGVGGYCLNVFPPSPQSEDIYATVRATRP